MRRKTGYVQNRGSSFRIAYYSADHVRQFESFSTEEEAHRELAKRLAEVAAGIPVSSKPNTVKFGELCADVVADYKVRKLKSLNVINLRYRLHIIPVFGDRKAISITASQLKQYVLQRQSQGASAGTIARELEAIRRAFKLAEAEGKFLGKVPKIPKLAENRRVGFFTRAEVDRLCSHLKPPLDSFVLFAFLTGWRLEEIRGLQWRNVDFDRGEIRLDPGSTKNGEARVFPMTAELRNLLKAPLLANKTAKAGTSDSGAVTLHRVTTMAGFVFSVLGKPIGDFRKTWKTACHKAGLPCVVEPVRKGGKKGAVKVIKALRIFHDLRRSAAREFQRQGYTDGQIMRMCGWLTRSVFDRYAIVTDEDIRATMERIEAKHHSASGTKEAQ